MPALLFHLETDSFVSDIQLEIFGTLDAVDFDPLENAIISRPAGSKIFSEASGVRNSISIKNGDCWT